MKIKLIVACGKNGEIGLNNDLIWKIPDDLKMFKQLTMGGTVVMGRKTFESIGKPLPGRKNVVITRTMPYLEGVEVSNNLEEALNFLKIDEGLYDYRTENEDHNNIWIIGGSEIYKQSIDFVDEMYITRIDDSSEADAYFVFDKDQFDIVDKKEFSSEFNDKIINWELIHYLKKSTHN
jgi:dihydrofolate reductase